MQTQVSVVWLIQAGSRRLLGELRTQMVCRHSGVMTGLVRVRERWKVPKMEYKVFESGVLNVCQQTEQKLYHGWRWLRTVSYYRMN